ncbi:hypothetical protein JD79_04382 [Geodermatophilus normandii]|uniref:Uncharacterized protein n=1 Tax=Geodermatophilus normandii TaxID=1137989 RepID=A0A317QQB3_9ACTN|nr:hypothetical protein [Geodermatophilus normandii]PWW25184.1 hypothetical protein JD79_04382 [Geodermatophilus normandii]
MEDLFRLMLLRPAVTQDPESPSIDLTQDSDYQNALREAVPGGREGAEEVSRAYVQGDEFLGDPAGSEYAAELAKFAALLDGLEDEPVVRRPPQDQDDDGDQQGSVARAVRTAFGRPASEVVDDEMFQRMLRRLRDSLTAIKVLQEEHTRPVEELTRQLRTAEVVRRAASEDRFDGGPALHAYRRRSLRLPVVPGWGSRLSTRDAEEQLRQRRAEAIAEREAQVGDLLGRHEALRVAIAELGSLEGRHFRVSAVEGSEAVDPPEELRLTSAMAAESTFTRDLRTVSLRRLGGTIDEGPIIEEAGEQGGDTAAGSTTVPDGLANLAATLAGTTSVAAPGRVEFSPPDLTEAGFILQPEATEALTEGTRTLLADRGLDLSAVPLDRITQGLGAELTTTVERLEQIAGHPVRQSFTRVGDALVSVQTPIVTGWGTLGTGGLLPVPVFPMDGRIPHTRGAVAPAGVADLLVVRQQLIGYEGADVAHIENVLRGERKLREHTRREESEVFTLSESEVGTSEERELETADRFEMTRETSTTIKEDAALKAGLNISGSYGPTVEFAVSAEGSLSRSKEEATKAASSFSQDVTERSSRKIAERILERTTTRLTTETIEKNTHELNNVKGAGHVSGVYQWVNKVYQAQMYNYGLRATFDFMVPEPAAFIVAAMNRAHAGTVTLTKPPTFTLLPAQINESNYGYWVQVYQAKDVAPPPELYRTKSADFKAGGGDKNTNYNHSGQIAIDDGYRAVFGSVGRVLNQWEGDCALDVVLGRRTQRMGAGNWLWTTTLDDERDTVPFALDSFHVAQVAVAIEVKCQRTERAMEKWRLETHAKLATAHAALVADYEEKLAALQLQAGVAIRGRNPAANQLSIRTELKKNCISILTDQHFDLFDAMKLSASTGLPQLDVFETAGEGPYVRFFEQAFEWEQMTWVTYPYFWGRKDQWDERIAYDDPDPAFNEFLQAGYARVSVPARPGFEGAIDHFLTFGETWNGGPLPPITSALYLPIADEIAERLDRPGAEVPQGAPWIVRVPTNLVHLRADDRLPRWEQNQQGEWVEVGGATSDGPSSRQWSGTAHQEVPSTLATDQTAWTQWPSAAVWQVPIPDWAADVDFTFSLSPGVVGGDVWGELRLDFGGSVTDPSRFDVNYEADQTEGPEQALMLVGGTHHIPEEIRGKSVTVKMEGRMLDPANHSGHLEAYYGSEFAPPYGTRINGLLSFRRRPAA